MNYLMTRLKQGSTWLGILAAASALIQSHGLISPDVVGTLLTAFGLIHIDDTRGA